MKLRRRLRLQGRKDDEGRTPADLAKDLKRHAILKILNSWTPPKEKAKPPALKPFIRRLLKGFPKDSPDKPATAPAD